MTPRDKAQRLLDLQLQLALESKTLFAPGETIEWKHRGRTIQRGHVIKHWANGNIQVLPDDAGDYRTIMWDDVFRAIEDP